MLQMLVEQGLLAPGRHGEKIEEFLFPIFATFPFRFADFD
jgi:hypothetical protein